MKYNRQIDEERNRNVRNGRRLDDKRDKYYLSILYNQSLFTERKKLIIASLHLLQLKILPTLCKIKKSNNVQNTRITIYTNMFLPSYAMLQRDGIRNFCNKNATECDITFFIIFTFMLLYFKRFEIFIEMEGLSGKRKGNGAKQRKNSRREKGKEKREEKQEGEERCRLYVDVHHTLFFILHYLYSALLCSIIPAPRINDELCDDQPPYRLSRGHLRETLINTALLRLVYARHAAKSRHE